MSKEYETKKANTHEGEAMNHDTDTRQKMLWDKFSELEAQEISERYMRTGEFDMNPKPEDVRLSLVENRGDPVGAAPDDAPPPDGAVQEILDLFARSSHGTKSFMSWCSTPKDPKFYTKINLTEKPEGRSPETVDAVLIGRALGILEPFEGWCAEWRRWPTIVHHKDFVGLRMRLAVAESQDGRHPGPSA
jgi:hypothetical protein